MALFTRSRLCRNQQRLLTSAPKVRNNDSLLVRIQTHSGPVIASQWAPLTNYFSYRVLFKLEYWCGEKMPDWLSALDRQLSRFGFRLWSPVQHKFLHYQYWFRRELAKYVEERSVDIARHGPNLWNRTFLMPLTKEHREGRKNYVREIDVVLTPDAVDRVLLSQYPACHLN